MLPFLKSLSRTVHHYHEHHHHYQEEEEKQTIHNTTNNSQKKMKITNEEAAASISLTVWRKSLVLTCSGFTVIAPDGTLAFRVDNYTRRPHHILLMDGLGNPIFTICRPKKLKLVDNYWHVYEGDQEGKLLHRKPEPILSARKNVINGNVTAHIFCGEELDRKRPSVHVVEGSYAGRSCKILDGSRRVVGEINKKKGAGSTRGAGASFGLDVFELVVREGLESRLGMAIVLLLDQM